MSPLPYRGAVYRTSELTATRSHQDAATQELIGLTPVSAGTKMTQLMQRFVKKLNLVVNQLIY